MAGFFATGVRGVAGFFVAAARGAVGFFSPVVRGVAGFLAAAERGAAGFFSAAAPGAAGFFAAVGRGLRDEDVVEALRGDDAPREADFGVVGVSSPPDSSATAAAEDAGRRGARGLLTRGFAVGAASTLAASSSDEAGADSGGCGSDAVITTN
ncbi:hypothetical protein [Microbacterium sp. Bi128]|uniref:hypothetical protein n=1 Tax=Microbacterium sp. Bi128 TaxID=2821115 RepID=UPI001E4B8915|nr:hypothetical protein [Microbacterium sp. Bi128]